VSLQRLEVSPGSRTHHDAVKVDRLTLPAVTLPRAYEAMGEPPYFGGSFVVRF
jgi:hypothetical protein